MTHAVEIVQVPARTTAVTHIHLGADEMPTIGEKMGEAFGTVARRLGEAGLSPAGPALAFYRPTQGGFDIAVGFEVADTFIAPPGLERLDIGACEVAHTTHLGPYAELPSAYEALQDEVTRRGRALHEHSPMWEEYWSGPDTPDDQTRTEVFWPVATGP